MSVASLEKLLVHDLKDLYSAEKQLVEAQADRLLSRIGERTVNFQAMV